MKRAIRCPVQVATTPEVLVRFTVTLASGAPLLVMLPLMIGAAVLAVVLGTALAAAAVAGAWRTPATRETEPERVGR